MTSGTVFADEDSKVDYTMSSLIFLAVNAILVKWAAGHGFFEELFDLLWWF